MIFTEKNRRDVLDKIDTLVAKKFYDPKFKGHDWPALVESHRDRIMTKAEPPEFEGAVNNMLRELGSSGLGLISPKTRIASKNAISATFHDCETEFGRRWVFQDVHAGGPAANAGIKPGDVLMSIGGIEITPADKKPLFAMGQSHNLVIEKVTGTSKVTISIPVAKHSENPCAVPDRVRVEMIDGVAVVKIPLFPGKLGIDFAAQVSEVFDSQLKSVDRLVLDLRGNPGGGLGCLRLMSILVPGNNPIGFSLGRADAENGYDRDKLPRFSRIPRTKFEVPWLALRFVGRKSVVLVTEGIGARRFHERVVVLVNEHTTCASEMVALFAREETGAQILGSATPGRLVSHTGFKLDHGFTLALPVAAYMSWTGTRLDGTGIEPEFNVDWSYSDSRHDIDTQLSDSVKLAKSL
jgi:C-terminal processing protease CtpA/Prc